jgi:hypothetical protein
MSEIYVALKGSDADIERAEQLVAGINNMYAEAIKEMGEPACHIRSMREERIKNYLAKESGNNEAVKDFVSGFMDDDEPSDIEACSFSFDRSEKTLWIGRDDDYGTFDTEAWTYLLADTLQCRSLFFIFDQYSPTYGRGADWLIYENEKWTVGGEKYYREDDEAFLDEEKYENVEYVYEVIETLYECSKKWAFAELKVWQLKDSPGQLLEDAKDALESAKKELEEKERLYYGGGDSAVNE